MQGYKSSHFMNSALLKSRVVRAETRVTLCLSQLYLAQLPKRQASFLGHFSVTFFFIINYIWFAEIKDVQTLIQI